MGKKKAVKLGINLGQYSNEGGVKPAGTKSQVRPKILSDGSPKNMSKCEIF